MSDNKLAVLLFGVPLIIVLIIALFWFTWVHFPRVQQQTKRFVGLMIRRRLDVETPKANLAIVSVPSSSPSVPQKAPPEENKAKAERKPSKFEEWFKKKVWPPLKKRVLRLLALASIAALIGLAIVAIVWFVQNFSIPKNTLASLMPNVGGLVPGLVIATCLFVALVICVGILSAMKNRKDKREGEKTEKPSNGKKADVDEIDTDEKVHGFLKIWGLTAVWIVTVLVFGFLEWMGRASAPWEFIWTQNRAITIPTTILLLLWSLWWTSWKFFKKTEGKNDKTIALGSGAIATLIISLWTFAILDTETVRGWRGKSGSVQGAIASITDDTPSYKFTVNLAPGESYYVRPFMVSQDDWSRTIRLYPGVKLRIVYGGTVTVQLKEKDQFWFVEDGPKEKTSLNKRRVTGLNGEDTFIDVDPDRISFRARGEDKHVQIHMIRTN